MTAFLPFDTVGTIFRSSYPALAPVYTLTTILTEQISMSFEGYQLPLATSILTVQPFNESQNKAISFTVSCQAHCEDENYTEVCQSRRVNIAGWYYILIYLVCHYHYLSLRDYKLITKHKRRITVIVRFLSVRTLLC